MAKQKGKSRRVERATVVASGLLASGVLLVATPAGFASAVPVETPDNEGNASAIAVGRPGFDNPAPGVRAIQALGDRVYNDSTPFNSLLNKSPLGNGYHIRYGTTSTGKMIPNPDFDPNDPASPETILDPGSNGSNVGQLNIAWAAQPYNLAQGFGVPLPDEADLPGKIPQVLSGNKPVQAMANKSTTCTRIVGATTVSAQGTC